MHFQLKEFLDVKAAKVGKVHAIGGKRKRVVKRPIVCFSKQNNRGVGEYVQFTSEFHLQLAVKQRAKKPLARVCQRRTF